MTVTENQRKRRISKLAANAKQLVNQGASGDMRAAKVALDLAFKAERERVVAPVAPMLSANDQEIVARFVARLRTTFQQEAPDAADG